MRHWVGDPLEIASVADVPAGTGLGSSGAYTVCLLKALALARSHGDDAGRPRRARVRDRDRHPQGAGRQAGSVRRRARRHLRLHVSRRRHASTSARSLLAEADAALDGPQLPALLHGRRALGVGDPRRPGHAHARRRCRDGRQPAPHEGDRLRVGRRCSRAATSSATPSSCTSTGRTSGAARRGWRPSASTRSTRSRAARARSGGKLVGAGGGGFLLVYAPRPDDTRQAMAAAGAPELSFEFDFFGCVGQEFR